MRVRVRRRRTILLDSVLLRKIKEKFSSSLKIQTLVYALSGVSQHRHFDIKTAIALSMFGGQPKNAQGKH
jgi:DNA replicative helicase MCM subunit Mcm2 (Cdc46/Mcm family)